MISQARHEPAATAGRIPPLRLPLFLIVLFAAFSFLPWVRANPRLAGSFWGAADYFSTLVILALAVLGFARGGLRGWPAGAWLAPLLLLVVTLPTRANPRFRAPIDPYLIALASAAFVGWARGGARSLSLRRQPGGS